jgi:hypothetical protein
MINNLSPEDRTEASLLNVASRKHTSDSEECPAEFSNNESSVVTNL